jgi:hypothetical protein
MTNQSLETIEEFSQCQNCESTLKEQYDFCPNCGQKTNDELTIGVLFYNTISNYFSFDARFLKSFIPLLFKPGFLAKKFLEGKRLLYLHPAQMYLFISVVFFFIFSFTVRNQAEIVNREIRESFNETEAVVLKYSAAKIKVDSINKIVKHESDSIARSEVRKVLEDNKWLAGVDQKEIDSLIARDDFSKNDGMNFNFGGTELDSLIKVNAPDDELYKSMGLEDDDGWFTKKMYAQALKFYKARDGGSILKAFYDTIPIALFFLLPIFAFILKILFYNKGRYAHHLVFSFYYFSFLFTVFSIIFGVNLFWEIPNRIDFLIALSTFVYLFIALKRFYGQGWFLSFFKSGVATFTFMLMVIPIAAVIIGLLSFMFY